MRLVIYIVACVSIVFQCSNAGPQRNSVFRDDYTYFESTDAFYKFHSTQETWVKAKKTCAAEGAMMFYPRNDTEVEALFEWSDTKKIDRIFVGISDLLTKGDYETLDGYPVEDMYNVWAPGEVNDLDCVVLQRSGKFLTTEECTAKIPFVCTKALMP